MLNIGGNWQNLLSVVCPALREDLPSPVSIQSHSATNVYEEVTKSIYASAIGQRFPLERALVF